MIGSVPLTMKEVRKGNLAKTWPNRSRAGNSSKTGKNLREINGKEKNLLPDTLPNHLNPHPPPNLFLNQKDKSPKEQLLITTFKCIETKVKENPHLMTLKEKKEGHSLLMKKKHITGGRGLELVFHPQEREVGRNALC